MVREATGGHRPRTEQRDGLLGVDREEIFTRLLLIAHHGVHVSELGLDERRLELGHVFSTPIHEYDVDDVITNVPLSLHLSSSIIYEAIKTRSIHLLLVVGIEWE